MTVKMTQAKNKLNMPVLRRRIRKQIMKRYGKKIKLSQVDKVWKEYVEHGIAAPLAKYGSVEIDKNMKLEVVGTKVVDDKRLYNLFLNGKLSRKNGTVSRNPSLNQNRSDVVYGIKLTDKNFKEGKLYFYADKAIKKPLINELKNGNTYYNIK
jgi:hypothetical protein